MAEIEIEAKTVEEAIQEGLAKLNCSRDKVEVKILNEGASGLFGLMGTKPARVRLTTKEEGAACEVALDYPKAQEQVKEILGKILTMMKIGYQEITTSLMTGRILADIKSEESSLIIGKNGQTLEALENIVNLMLHKEPDTRIKVALDSEGFRMRQEERLQAMAQKAAEQVKKTNKPYHFDPMPSRERRVIHLFLKADPDIETFSEGEGIFRRVIIKPKNRG